MFKYKSIVCVFLALVLLTSSWSLYAQKKNLIFNAYSSEQGLSQNSVTSIAQDKFGFIWLGTENGLNKFDGYQITQYFHNIEDNTSISADAINDIVVDKNNRIWIATDDGLNCFNQESETFLKYLENNNNSTSILSNKLTCLYFDSKNYLWVGSRNGLSRTAAPISKNTNIKLVKFKNFSSNLSNKHITYLFEDFEHNIWVGTKNGLNKINGENANITQHYPLNNSIAPQNENEITSIIQDNKFRFWIGTNNGLYWFNEAINTFTDLKKHEYFLKNKNANHIKHMLIDHANNIFIGTYGGGLLLFSEKDNSFYTYKNEQGNNYSLARNYVAKLFEDQSKTLFVSTVGKGFATSNLNTENFITYKNDANDTNSIKDNVIRTIYCENDNTIWLGLQKNGLSKFNIEKNTFTHYSFQSLKQNNILPTIKAICKEDSVNLWLGTLEKGLILFNTKTGIYKEQKFIFNVATDTFFNVFGIKKDKNGNLWIASYNKGLYKLNIKNGESIHYGLNEKDKNHITSNDISSVFIDKKNQVWFTTWGDGFYIINQHLNKIKHYNKSSSKNSIPSNFTTTTYMDKNNVFWIGTSVGLSRFDIKTESFENFNRKHGLINEYVYAIEEDLKGRLWISTNHGISLFDKQTKTFINYDVKDGLQANEFNIESSCKTPNGKLLFGGINGFNIFHPDSISSSKFSPKISINKLSLFNKNVAIAKKYNGETVLSKSIKNTDTLHLSYKNNFLGFEFSAHDYSKQNTIKYAYQLVGLENEWNVVSGNKRVASYTNLFPGNYTFKVKSTNADGIWQNNEKNITIIITPPFWKTTWFITIAILLVLSVAGLIYWFSGRWLINQNRKLEKTVDQRTLAIDERNIQLAEKITEINSQKEELLAQTEQLKQLNSELEILSTVAKEMKNSLVIMDGKGDFLLANKAFKDIYTLSFEEMKNKFGNNIFEVPFPDYIFEIINRCFNEKVSVQYEVEHSDESLGKSVWIHTNMTPILSAENEIKNVIIIDTDITEIKRREMIVLELAEQLQAKAEDLNITNLQLKDKNSKITEQSVKLKSLSENLEVTNKSLEDLVSKRTKDLKTAKEQAEKANQLKTIFLSNLSHEIRTPMNAICGFSSLMCEKSVGINSRVKYSKIINDNVDSLLLLIDNIMDLSKLQSKQIKLDNKEIDVKKTLSEIYYMYIVEDMYVKENVKFKLKLNIIDDFEIIADKKRFKQIFINLIDNAIKYTEKGSIFLSAQIESTKNERKTLIISVKDTGIGIKSNEISEIFEHFRTIDDKIKLYRGTGLGLAIVQELLQIYNWEVDVKSTLGKGSSFNIKIPIEIKEKKPIV